MHFTADYYVIIFVLYLIYCIFKILKTIYLEFLFSIN